MPFKEDTFDAAYAIEAIRIFDHLHFRTRMRKAEEAGRTRARAPLLLREPRAISGKPAWFEEYYVPGSQKENDRKIFSR